MLFPSTSLELYRSYSIGSKFGWQKRENEYVRLLVEKGEFLWIIPFQLQLNLFHSFDNMEFINNY